VANTRKNILENLPIRSTGGGLACRLDLYFAPGGRAKINNIPVNDGQSFVRVAAQLAEEFYTEGTKARVKANASKR
jgi:hypothetical protein